jgi:hypothetical protein
MPSYIICFFGFILVFLHPPSGFAVLIGTVGGFVGSTLEMMHFATPSKRQ